jgi:phosphatidylglycerophosphatase A
LKGPLKTLAVVVGTGLYSGYFPFYSGTAGSAAGLVLYLILVWTGAIGTGLYAGWAIALAAIFAAGVPAAGACERLFGEDSKRIVVDEVWGMLISMVLLPPTWYWILPAFVLFRFFDVVKPFPARRAERVGGGLGVMLDDGVAGLYTCLVLHGARVVFQW